jgi:hypothetical protein
MTRFDSFIGFGLIGLLLACVLALATLFGALAADTAFERRAFDAQTACLVRQMEPRRKPLSAVVACVPIPPRPAGRDSLRLEVAP